MAGLDPRLTPETPLAEQGPVRIWETTDRPLSEVPPHLTGCQVTFRHRINAAETDIEAIIQTVNEELIPDLREMDGFVLYGWLGTPDGRISFNIWETAEQLAAGDAVRGRVRRRQSGHHHGRHHRRLRRHHWLRRRAGCVVTRAFGFSELSTSVQITGRRQRVAGIPSPEGRQRTASNLMMSVSRVIQQRLGSEFRCTTLPRDRSWHR